jgi:hypothetical protein
MLVVSRVYQKNTFFPRTQNDKKNNLLPGGAGYPVVSMKSKIFCKWFVHPKLGPPPRKASFLVMEGAGIIRWAIIKHQKEAGTNGDRRPEERRPEEGSGTDLRGDVGQTVDGTG